MNSIQSVESLETELQNSDVVHSENWMFLNFTRENGDQCLGALIDALKPDRVERRKIVIFIEKGHFFNAEPSVFWGVFDALKTKPEWYEGPFKMAVASFKKRNIL